MTKLPAVLSLAMLLGIAGCELVSSVDRSKIPMGSGGGGGNGTTSSTGGTGGATSSSSSSGTGGATSSSSGTGGTGGGTSSSSGTGGATSSSTSSSSGTGGATASSSSSSSSGTGGAGGGTTSSSSSSSSGGLTCTQPSDCPPTGNVCIAATCVSGTCGTAFVAAGTATASQTPGDCHQNQCDGAGNITNAVDDTDLPDDQNACTNDLCNAGVSSHTNVASGTSCGTGTTCDGSGHCVGCVQATDCPGQDTECQTRTCTGGMCGFSFTASGFVTSSQTPGDCHTNKCDGAGNITNAVDDADVPADDGNQCTSETCNAGTPQHPPTAPGTTCNQNGGTKCSAGACVQCLAAADCGADTACQKKTCNSGTCGVNNLAAGTVVGNPTPGDCRSNQCDGSGGINNNAVDNTDVPADDGNQCTSETCSNGTPQHPNQPQGTTCNQNGGTACNASGACVSCSTASDCGADTACQTHTCNSGVCGVNNVQAGTVVANPVGGDCHSNQCDGSGGILVNAVDNTDVPADDGNQCTSETCVAGAPQHPATGPGTTCSQNGGTKCNGSGSCVQCLVNADCGADTACQTHVCSAGTCSVVNVGTGIAVGNPTPGDCHTTQCDGSGNLLANVVDDTDLPVDGNACTDDVCTAGVPSNPPFAGGTACTQNGGTHCDGSGDCVQCVNAAECPSGNECVTPTCSAGLCDTSNVGAGTATSSQTPGDCKKNVCDGAGGIIAQNDDTDVQDDGNDCTTDVCSGGVSSHPSKAKGSSCTTSGNACDGAGACVQTFMVLRLGDGTTTLSSSATAAFVDEYKLDGTSFGTVAMPTAVSGANFRLTNAGSSTSEGNLSRSLDGKYVVMAGYDADVNTTTVATSSGIDRVIGRVDRSYAINTSTKLPSTAFGTSNVRSACTTNGTDLWASGTGSGTTGGMWYAALGSVGTGNQILSAPGNVRFCHVFLGQLYASASTTSPSNFLNVFSVGTGTPTTSGQTGTVLSGLTNASGQSVYSFVLLDTTGDSKPDLLYVADDRTGTTTGGIYKWTSADGGLTWTAGTPALTNVGTSNGARGLAGFFANGKVTLIASTNLSTPTIVVATDNLTGAAMTTTTVVTAASNKFAYRGVALGVQ